MATDAQINQIEVLSSFAVNISDFSSEVTTHSNAFVNLITEKMSELRLIQKKAEEICAAISEQRKKAFHAYSEVASSDNHELRRQLQIILAEAEEKEREAKRCLSIITENVGVAHGRVVCMIDQTKQFSKEAMATSEKGIAFLKQSQTTLEQYQSNSKKQ